jgi:NADH dehydrogenase
MREIRRRIFLAFEWRNASPTAKVVFWPATHCSGIVVCSDHSIVELAGTLGELAHRTLKDHFRSIDPAAARIFLLEGAERILSAFPPDLSAKAAVALTHLGVTVRTRTHVTDIRDSTVTMRSGEVIESLQARTIIWTAG